MLCIHEGSRSDNVFPRRIHRGSFRDVPSLVAAIQQYIHTHNQHPKVFIWSASAKRIMSEIAKFNLPPSATA